MPVMPQKDAGWRIEPPVSVPVAAGARRAATAAALPPDEPPGTRWVSQGLRTGVGAVVPTAGTATFSLAEPMANSSQLSLPSVTMPAPTGSPGAPIPSRLTTVASNGDW